MVDLSSEDIDKIAKKVSAKIAEAMQSVGTEEPQGCGEDRTYGCPNETAFGCKIGKFKCVGESFTCDPIYVGFERI
ncbi:Uncharacterised protein [uncultured archaeon]|nr:Uncharacterised protein [uncultured archaeon]